MRSREWTDDARLRALLEDAVEDPDERELGELVRQLRAQAPTAPEGVRERVRMLGDWEARQPVAKAPSPLRRTALALAAVLVLATLVGGIVRGAGTGGGTDESAGGAAPSAGGDAASAEGAQGDGAGAEGYGGDSSRSNRSEQGKTATALNSDSEDPATLPPSRRRAQDYRAYLRLHVEDTADLSQKTKRALALTRSYGGYVVSIDYDTGEEGAARLQLRVPIGRIQDAILDYSELGSILGQNVQVRDVQRQIDTRSRTIEELRERIQEVRAALLDEDLPTFDREQLEAELAELRARTDELRRERRATRDRASMARVALELTTSEEAPVVDRGGFEGALRDAGGILVKELTVILYGLIVAAPIAVLALLALLGFRAARRRADARLLERA